MINIAHDFYSIFTAMVPLYTVMVLAYGSVRWWSIFTPDQCSGINRFVAIFAIPFLAFHFISMSNPYIMNFRFLAADSLQKLIMLVALGVWTKFTKTGSFEWMITIFSLSTLPNSLVNGIPLLSAMYGESSASLMVQIVVMQCIVWNTLLLFMFEFRAAKALITERFHGSGGDIIKIEVDHDVVSLDEKDLPETDAEIGHDEKLHVTVRRSNTSRRSIEFGSLSCFNQKDHNILVRSSSVPIVSKGGRVRSKLYTNLEQSSPPAAKEIRMLVSDQPLNSNPGG